MRGDYPESESNETNGDGNSDRSDGPETTLVPKSMFGSKCEVGDTKKVKIVSIIGDELEVEYVSDDKKDSSKPEEGSDMDAAIAAIPVS